MKQLDRIHKRIEVVREVLAKPKNQRRITWNAIAVVFLCLIFSIFSIFYYAHHTHAATTNCTWTNGNNTHIWNDVLNWSCGNVPTNTNDVIFNGAISNADITIDVAATAGSFTVYGATSGLAAVSGTATVENTGINLNFTNNNANVTINGSTGVFSGYGWLDDVGWVDFGTIDNVDGPVTENMGTGAVTGKAKILNDGTLIDFNAAPYGSNVVVDTGTGVFSGYAWSTSLGWINFTGATSGVPYTGTITANQNLTLDTSQGGTGSYYLGSGTYVANATTITVPGNWTNSGTFTAGSGTVTFNGSSQSTIAGTTTFYNLNMDISAGTAKTIKFTAGTTQTISHTWTLNGAVGKVLTLRSTSDTNAWTFNIPAPMTSGDYIDVEDSYSANANKITPGANVTDSSNNDGWIFAGLSITTLTTDSADYPTHGQTVTVNATLNNDTGSDVNSKYIDYVIFIDTNGNHIPDAGETYVTSACAGSGAWAAGNYTFQTTGFNVAAGGHTDDSHNCANTNFPAVATYTLWAKWWDGATTTYATKSTTFTSVPTLTQILFLVLVSGGVYLGVKKGVIKIKMPVSGKPIPKIEHRIEPTENKPIGYEVRVKKRE